jgi:hypothetical protein
LRRLGKGRYFWNKRNEEGFRNGIEFFKRAEEKDPRLRSRSWGSPTLTLCCATSRSASRLFRNFDLR